MARLAWLSRSECGCLCILVGSLSFSAAPLRAQVRASCASTCGHTASRGKTPSSKDALALYNSLVAQSNQNAQAVANAVTNIVNAFLSGDGGQPAARRESQQHERESQRYEEGVAKNQYDPAAEERRRRAEEAKAEEEQAKAEQEARWAAEEAERAAAAKRAAEEAERERWANRQRLWAEQHGGSVEPPSASPSASANDPAAERLALWRAQHSAKGTPSDAPASSSPPGSAADDRLALWRAQHAGSTSAEAGSPMDAALNRALQEIQAIEDQEHIGTPDPISSTLDGLWNDIGETTAPPTSAALKSVAGAVNDRLLGMLRDGVGRHACATDAGGSGSVAVDQAYAGFWSGVCGGWLGRPISPSGVYGYVSENVIGGFTKLFDAATAELGLMPAAHP